MGKSLEDGKLYVAIHEWQRRLAGDSETAARYERATRGAKEWLCYSRWCQEEGRVDVEYHSSLLSWMMPFEIAYVLQFESDRRLINALKSGMIAAMERVTTSARVVALGRESMRERQRLVEKHRGSKNVFEGWACYASFGRVLFLEGRDEGAARCFHPDHGLYCEWYRRWVPGRGRKVVTTDV